jgi:hypothetical protein
MWNDDEGFAIAEKGTAEKDPSSAEDPSADA